MKDKEIRYLTALVIIFFLALTSWFALDRYFESDKIHAENEKLKLQIELKKLENK